MAAQRLLQQHLPRMRRAVSGRLGVGGTLGDPAAANHWHGRDAPSDAPVSRSRAKVEGRIRMVPNRLDDRTHGTVNRFSRRSALGVLGIGGLGAVLLARGFE